MKKLIKERSAEFGRPQSVDKLGLYALEEKNKKRDTSNSVYSALHFEINAFSRAFAKNSTTVPLYGDARFSQKIPSFLGLCQTVDFVYSLRSAEFGRPLKSLDL